MSKDKKSFKRDLYKEAASLGYLVQKQNGDPYILASGSSSFTFGMVDFTNPAAAAWYSKVITDNMLGRSQMGWMADFGEYLPFDAKLHNGNPLEQHNLYPEHWVGVGVGVGVLVAKQLPQVPNVPFEPNGPSSVWACPAPVVQQPQSCTSTCWRSKPFSRVLCADGNERATAADQCI